MRVFIVLAGHDYEGYDVQSVHSTNLSAYLAVDKLKAENRYDNFEIKSYEVEENE